MISNYLEHSLFFKSVPDFNFYQIKKTEEYFMNISFKDVVQHIYDYFEEHLTQYSVFEIRRKSYDPDDNYLYMVAAKHKNGTYAVWTSWNESIRSLNHGHYNLPNMKACAEIMTEYQTAHDTESSPLEYLQQFLIKHDDNFEDSYQQILYISGFSDGITSQYKNHWSQMTEREIYELYQEALKV